MGVLNTFKKDRSNSVTKDLVSWEFIKIKTIMLLFESIFGQQTFRPMKQCYSFNSGLLRLGSASQHVNEY